MFRTSARIIRIYLEAPKVPKSVVLDDHNSIELIRVPSGKITQKTGEITFVKAFYCSKYPVTNAQWYFFGRESNRFAVFWWDDKDFGKCKPDNPVVGVDWEDAKDFCAWKGLRLLNNAEWEKAARGTIKRRFPWGNDAPIPGVHANFGGIEQCTTQVSRYPAGKSPYGVCDMFGNVWEWTSDLVDMRDGKLAPRIIIRGGSFFDSMEVLGSNEAIPQADAGADYRNFNFGFRVAIDEILTSSS